VSAGQITTDLVQTVVHALAAAGCPATALLLEVTETAAMADAAHTRDLLAHLAEIGVAAAIDDFGTGYSSLAYLRRFPLRMIKIDREFIAGLGVEREDTAIVRAIISMAHGLGRSTVAEGVETAVQLDALRALGCDYAQGFYFAHPMPATEADDVVRSVTAGAWRPRGRATG
jgi:EAL domain-containing protein (putative c-di-GMP-specific phosphodiesterase class I)